MKFLVPTDFSKNAGNAINYASVLAKATKSELVLVNVYEPQVTHKNAAYALISEEIALAMKEANEVLARLCLETSDEYGIPCTSLVLSGNPVEEISAHADATKTDLIV